MIQLEQASTASQLKGWTQRRTLTSRDWEEHLPLIKKLYINEQRTLREVMIIMKETSGFVATVKMYKTRIKQWGLTKYCTFALSERSDPNNRGIFTVSSEDPDSCCYSEDVATVAVQEVPTDEMYTVHPGLMTQLPACGVSGRIEFLLWNVSVYTQSWLKERLDHSSESSQTSLDWNMFMENSAALLYQSDITQALKALGEACKVADTFIREQRNDMLLSVIVAFCRPQWRTFPDIRSAALRYLAGLGTTRLTRKHPLTIMITQLLDEEVFAYCIADALRVVFKLVDGQRISFYERCWNLKHVYCCMLVDEAQFTLALETSSTLLQEASVCFGSTSRQVRSSLLCQADAYLGLGEVEAARCCVDKAADLTLIAYGRLFCDAFGSEAAVRLLRQQSLPSYRNQGQYSWCRTALQYSLGYLSPQHASKMGPAIKAELQRTLYANFNS